MKFERYGIGIIKGMTVTIRHLLRHPTVSQYPEQRLNISRRTRGNELVWNAERCTGCGTCAKSCPLGAIEIVTETSPVDNKYLGQLITDAHGWIEGLHRVLVDHSDPVAPELA